MSLVPEYDEISDVSEVPTHTGILPGDFIKPDPALTRSETRQYILAELARLLSGRICSHAKEVSVTHADPADFADDLAAGRWPAARLYNVLYLLERGGELPTEYEERFRYAGEWSLEICKNYLNGNPSDLPAALVARGFVTTDLLPCGRTIESFWNHSPVEPLRNAPPLTDAEEAEEEEAEEEEDEEAEEEDEAEEEEAEEEEAEDEEDEDTKPVTAAEVLSTTYTLNVPGWLFFAGFAVVTAYLATVVAALSVCNR